MFISCTKEKQISDSGYLVPKTVDQDPGIPSIKANGVLLYSEAFGQPDSPMIICIHGGPGADYRYLLNCRDLANHGYYVVFYDQRGSGLSQRLSRASYTSIGISAIDTMYNELSAVIAHYKTHFNQKVFLMGHSWGAMLATGYVGKYPNAIKGMAICEPGGLKWDDVKEYLNNSRSASIFSEALNDVTYQDQFITGKKDEHAVLDYKMALAAVNNANTGEDNTQPESFWRYGAVISSAFFDIGKDYKPDFSEGIGNFKIPILFFYSEKNKAYSDSWMTRITSFYNKVKVVKVLGTGHDGIIKDKKTWAEITMPEMLKYFNSL